MDRMTHAGSPGDRRVQRDRRAHRPPAAGGRLRRVRRGPPRGADAGAGRRRRPRLRDGRHRRRVHDGGVARIIEEQGRIDVLVNNAGYGSYGAVEDVPIDEARRQFEVNVFGLARLTQLVTPHMRAIAGEPLAQRPRIVNISSIGGKFYEPLGAWYHATKFAVEGFSDSLRIELAPHGIDVIIIEPGPIRTEWNEISRDSLARGQPRRRLRGAGRAGPPRHGARRPAGSPPAARRRGQEDRRRRPGQHPACPLPGRPRCRLHRARAPVPARRRVRLRRQGDVRRPRPFRAAPPGVTARPRRPSPAPSARRRGRSAAAGGGGRSGGSR